LRSSFAPNSPVWLIDTMRGQRGYATCRPLWSWFARTGLGLVLDGSEMVGGDYLSHFGSVLHKIALFASQTQRDGPFVLFGSGLHGTAPFGPWTSVED